MDAYKTEENNTKKPDNAKEGEPEGKDGKKADDKKTEKKEEKDGAKPANSGLPAELRAQGLV